MKKILALAGTGFIAAAMIGCGLSPVGAPVITIDPISDVQKAATTTYTKVTGKAAADTVITAISYRILTSTDQLASGITVSGPAAPMDAEKLSFSENPIQINVTSGAATGTYKLEISITGGVSVVLVPATFQVVAASGNLTEKALVLGAQNAAPHSLLDADIMKVFPKSLADETTRGQVDLIFSFSTIPEPDSLAFTAPDSAIGAPYDAWVNRPHTLFKKVFDAWASLTTPGSLTTAWSGGGSSSSCVAVVAGDVVIVQTSTGAYKAVQIVSITGYGATATIAINGKY